MAERFRLGTVADPPPEHRSYLGRLAIPIIKRAGITGWQFRCVEDHEKCEGHAKYLTRGAQQIWGVTAVDEPGDSIEICEGYLDGISLWGVCDLPSVALPGVDSWAAHPWWKRIVQGIGTVRVWADPDPPGAKLAEQICKDVPHAYAVDLPDGQDVNKCLTSYGPGFLMDLAGV